jgi:exodeoxyribonuclease VII small subunit
MTPKEKKYKDFESALERLEEITEKLESGETKLEESIDLYTEGIEIAGVCAKQLAEVEKKVKILKEKNQKMVEELFEGEADAEDTENGE